MLPEAKVRKQKDHSNYRSVILASVLSKIMEKLIRASISIKLKDDSIIGASQDGYMEKQVLPNILMNTTTQVA